MKHRDLSKSIHHNSIASFFIAFFIHELVFFCNFYQVKLYALHIRIRQFNMCLYHCKQILIASKISTTYILHQESRTNSSTESNLTLYKISHLNNFINCNHPLNNFKNLIISKNFCHKILEVMNQMHDLFQLSSFFYLHFYFK